MKGGSLVIGGNAGFLTGFMMQKGRIIICGDAGEALGDSMYEGTIYVAGNIASLGADAMVEEMTEDELIDVLTVLEARGITDKRNFTKVVSAKRFYNYDSLGAAGEICTVKSQGGFEQGRYLESPFRMRKGRRKAGN